MQVGLKWIKIWEKGCTLFFGEFAEFDKHAAGGLRMDEGNFRIVSTGSGFLIDHGRSLFQIGSTSASTSSTSNRYGEWPCKHFTRGSSAG
jgi:hypothetical protein